MEVLVKEVEAVSFTVGKPNNARYDKMPKSIVQYRDCRYGSGRHNYTDGTFLYKLKSGEANVIFRCKHKGCQAQIRLRQDGRNMFDYINEHDLTVNHTGDAKAIEDAIKFSTAASAATHPVCQPRANLNHETDEEQAEAPLNNTVPEHSNEARENPALRLELDEAKDQIMQLKEQLEGKENLLKKCQEDLVIHQKSLQKDDNDIPRYQRAIEKLRQLLKNEIEYRTELEYNLKTKEGLLDEALSAHKDKESKLQAEVDKLKVAVNDYVDALEQLQTKYDVLEAKYEQILTDHKNLLEHTQDLENTIIELTGKIRVFLVIKPTHPAGSRPLEIIKRDTKLSVLHYLKTEEGEEEKSKEFHFDGCFDSLPTNAIHSHLNPMVVSAVREGNHVCIFAYGQTGSGKSYTMEDGNHPLIPSLIASVFETCEQKKNDGWTHEISISIVHVYNNAINDALTDDPKFKMMDKVENREKSFRVSNLQDALEKLAEAKEKRKSAKTLCNDHSSRSHSITTIKILGKKGRATTDGTIVLVDLAGNEVQSKSGAVGPESVEAKNINLDLSDLGNVIRAFQPSNADLPVYNRELTKYLKQAFQKECKTVMLAHVTREEADEDQTRSTLQTAAETFQVQLKATKEPKPAAKEPKTTANEPKPGAKKNKK